MSARVKADELGAGGQRDDIVVEALMVLSTAQLRGLQQSAQRRGLSVGQLLRELVCDYLDPTQPEALPPFCTEVTLHGQRMEVSPQRVHELPRSK